MSTCGWCGEDVVWASLSSAYGWREVPLEPEPVKGGNVVLVNWPEELCETDTVGIAYIVPEEMLEEMAIGQPLYAVHEDGWRGFPRPDLVSGP